MLVPTCDRCRMPHVQLVPVLGVDVCNECVKQTKEFLSTATPYELRGPALTLAQARSMIERYGHCDAASLALVRREDRSAVYDALMYLRRRGFLVHLGDGIFGLSKEAADGKEEDEARSRGFLPRVRAADHVQQPRSDASEVEGVVRAP